MRQALLIALLAGTPMMFGAADPMPQIQTVPVGGAMLELGGTRIVKGIMLTESNDIMHRRFSAGFYPQVREDANYTYHSFLVGHAAGGLGALTGLRDVRLLSAAKSGQKLCISLGRLALGFKPCDTERAYARIERVVPDPAVDHQQLSYAGIVHNVVRLSYSHTPAGAAAATTQQAEYDLNQSNLITFRDARIRVVKADGASITFVVVTPLSTGS